MLFIFFSYHSALNTGFNYRFFTSFQKHHVFNRCGHVMSSYSMKRDMVATIRARTSSVCVCLVLKSSMTIGNCVDFLVVCVLLEKTRVKDGWAVIMHFKGPRAILASPEAKDATLIAWLPSITKLFFRTPLIRWHANDAGKREMPKPRV